MSETIDTPLPETSAKAKPQVSATVDFLRFLAKLAVFVFVLRSFIFQPVSIPSESMLPRLLIGDYVIVSKYPYGYSTYSLWLFKRLRVGLLGERAEFSTEEGSGSRVFGRAPERGDVAVFKAPPGNETDYIKRVIGLPGDTVQLQAGTLSLNGKAIPKVRAGSVIVLATIPQNGTVPTCGDDKFNSLKSDGVLWCTYPRFKETLPGGKSYFVLDTEDRSDAGGGIVADYTDIYRVPDGHFFAMGDNRDRSADSRFEAVEGGGIGIVPQENLVGRAWFTIFSTDGSSSWFLPWTWFTAARWDRIGEGF